MTNRVTPLDDNNNITNTTRSLKGTKIMVNEPSNEELEQVEEVSVEDWNAACDLWDLMHDEHGLQGF